MNSEKTLKEPPYPYDVAVLPEIESEPWVLLDDDMAHPGAEGPAFDVNGNLYVCRGGPPPGPDFRILKITPEKEVIRFFEAGSMKPMGIQFHPDGRLFAACITGELLILDPDGKLIRAEKQFRDGQLMSFNDCIFDHKGNLYLTDWRGSLFDPIGAVVKYTPESDYTEYTVVVDHLCKPNGVSLSPDDRVMWIAEPGQNRILRATITEDGKLFAAGSPILPVYYNTGKPVPDSNKVDCGGYLYQGMQFGGYLLVLDPNGFPVAKVTSPFRKEGENLETPNLTIRPGTREGFLVSSGRKGSWVCRFEALNEALLPFSHS